MPSSQHSRIIEEAFKCDKPVSTFPFTCQLQLQVLKISYNYHLQT